MLSLSDNNQTDIIEAFGILGQVWYLIVSIPDLCNLLTFLTHPPDI